VQPERGQGGLEEGEAFFPPSTPQEVGTGVSSGVHWPSKPQLPLSFSQSIRVAAIWADGKSLSPSAPGRNRDVKIT